MQLRQAYGPPGRAQKAATSKAKQPTTGAPDKSRRFLVQSDGFGNLMNHKPQLLPPKVNYGGVTQTTGANALRGPYSKSPPRHNIMTANMATLPSATNSTPVTQQPQHSLQPIHLQSQLPPSFGTAVHQELSNIKNMGLQILQK